MEVQKDNSIYEVTGTETVTKKPSATGDVVITKNAAAGFDGLKPAIAAEQKTVTPTANGSNESKVAATASVNLHGVEGKVSASYVESSTHQVTGGKLEVQAGGRIEARIDSFGSSKPVVDAVVGVRVDYDRGSNNLGGYFRASAGTGGTSVGVGVSHDVSLASVGINKSATVYAGVDKTNGSGVKAQVGLSKSF